MRTQGATVIRRAAWEERDGVLFSPLLSSLGVVAGFTTRRLGSMGGRETPADEATRRRNALAARLGFGEVVRVKQVHGDRVLYAPFVWPGPASPPPAFVRPGPASPAPAGPHSEAPWPEADGMWTDRQGVLLGVVAADCVPILVADDAGRIGAAHAGWEGTSRRIAQRLVAALREAGAEPSRMGATIGPSIGPCCYAIGRDRADLIRERLGALADDALLERAGEIAFDLWTANVELLREEGVGRIEVAGTCTKSGGVDLWSSRAGQIGSLGLAFIGRRPEAAEPPADPWR